MTVLEASLKITDFFKTNDIFVYPNDLSKLLIIFDKDEERLAIKKALEAFEKENILSAEISENKTIFILNRKLEQIEQTIILNGSLPQEIAKTINDFCKNIAKDETDFCDPIEIKIKDLWNLIHIINFFKKTLDETLSEE